MISENHKGHHIFFDQASEEWRCDQLGLSNKSLKTIKAAVDRFDKKQRTMAIPALYLDQEYWSDEAKIVECTIVMIRADRHVRTVNVKFGKEVQAVELRSLYPVSARENVEALVAAKNRLAGENAEVERLEEVTSAFTAEALREAVVQQAEEAA